MNTIETKVCNVCNKEKSIGEFYTQKKFSNVKGDWIYVNPECKECTKSRSVQWRTENKEDFMKSIKKYIDQPHVKIQRRKMSNEARRNGDLKKWQQKNKDKMKLYREARKMNKTHDITEEEWTKCKEFFNNSCAYCEISEEEAKKEYNNYLHKEHVDHTGSNKIDNCVPACKSCNGLKWTFELSEWYNEDNKLYTFERYKRITDWLNLYYNENKAQ